MVLRMHEKKAVTKQLVIKYKRAMKKRERYSIP